MENNHSPLWEKVEQDKLKYKVFLWVSLATWALTIGTLTYIGYLFYLEHQHIYDLYQRGLVKDIDVYDAKKNIYTVVLSISMIVAFLSSVVVIMRQRSSSLQDIQLRLAIVEQHLSEPK
jgi:hypothetical protein